MAMCNPKIEKNIKIIVGIKFDKLNIVHIMFIVRKLVCAPLFGPDTNDE